MAIISKRLQNERDVTKMYNNGTIDQKSKLKYSKTFNNPGTKKFIHNADILGKKAFRKERVYHIYPTPPLGQDMTQGQFLSGV